MGSWCGPCRQQVPNLKKAYAKYQEKGFAIVAIALNDTEKECMKAIEKDGIPWHNVRDVDNHLYNLFDVAQIPAYILINNEGKLLAFACTGSSIPSFGASLKGEELHRSIEYYLGAQ